MNKRHEHAVSISEDPLSLLPRLATKLHTNWLRATYPFPEFGSGVSIHYSCDVARSASKHIRIKDQVYIAPEVWLNVVHRDDETDAKIVLGRRAGVGRRTTISAKNYVEIGDDVLFAPAVLIMDHNHEYSDPSVPIHSQGVTAGGRIIIEKNCWLGYNCVIFCAKGELIVGENSVIGAHAVVTKSIPPRSIVAGNPAKVIKTYDAVSKTWHHVLAADRAASVNVGAARQDVEAQVCDSVVAISRNDEN